MGQAVLKLIQFVCCYFGHKLTKRPGCWGRSPATSYFNSWESLLASHRSFAKCCPCFLPLSKAGLFALCGYWVTYTSLVETFVRHAYYKYFLSVCNLPFIFMCICVCMPWRPEEGAGSSRTGVTGECNLGSGNQTQVPLEEQQALLTTDSSV